MKFAMHIPVGDIKPGEFQSAAAIADMASALETARVDACFVTDHPAPSAQWLHANGHDALDPFTALAFIAANSSRLRLLTNILVLPYRNPFLTAKAAATLQVLSGGRVILGVGGGYQKPEFDALGVEFSERGVLFDEALEVIRMAWSGDVIVKKGRHFNALGNQPRPIPDPAPPIWIGGSSDKAVRRAALAGDGWCPFFATPVLSKNNQATGLKSVEHLGEKIMQLKELRSASDRASAFDIAIGPRNLTNYGTNEGAEKYLEAMQQYAEVGVTWATVVPPSPSRQAYLENVQWFGEEVIARM